MSQDKGRAERARQLHEQARWQAEARAIQEAQMRAAGRAAIVERRKPRIPDFEVATTAALNRLEARGFPGRTELSVRKKPWSFPFAWLGEILQEGGNQYERALGWLVLSRTEMVHPIDYPTMPTPTTLSIWLLADGQYSGIGSFYTGSRSDNHPITGAPLFSPIDARTAALELDDGDYQQARVQLNRLGR